MSSSWERSPATAKTSTPVAALISPATRSSSPAFRLQITRLAPSCARESAQARPSPLLPPPMIATLSLSPRSMFASSLKVPTCYQSGPAEATTWGSPTNCLAGGIPLTLVDA